MAELLSGFELAEGETLVMKIEAELWAASPNPIAQIFGNIARTVAMILGTRKRGFLIITDKRVIEITEQIGCWCIVTGRQVKYVLPSSVKEIGYARKTVCGCLCPVYHLYYEGFTQCTTIQMKHSDEAAVLKAANAFYAAITRTKV